MKSPFFLFVVLLLLPATLPGTQHVVSTAGFMFAPPTLTVSVGDTIVFSLSLLHNAVEVAESTWNVNGDFPLPGGFGVPFGGGTVVMNDTGTNFYICEAHIASGMKGKIIVNPVALPTTTITLNSMADQDGLTGTTTDRIAKKWSLKLYQDSVGSGIVLDSVASGSTLSVAGLGAGTYVAAEADSLSWTHFSLVVNGVSQGATSQITWTFTVGAGENHTVTFLNTAPNMIISSGLTFVPDTLTVDNGDTVFFVLSPEHSPREVSKTTWLANGTASNGGFDLPAGGGTYVAAAGGIDYYVCVPHAGAGMKGLIMVDPIPPSTITLNSFADQDGDHATTTDRVAKNWSLKLYEDSVGSGIVVDSVVSGSSLSVNGLGPGVYVALEADSVPWSHISLTVDGVPQGSASQTSRSFSVGSAESRTVDFINHVPNMIINSGFAFSPETLTVDSGVTVHFVIEQVHTARQVDSGAWASNDTVSNGGFDLPFGGGSVLMGQAGNNYYVCVPHAPGGMKGIIRVMVEPSQGVLADSVADGWNLLSLPFAMPDSAVAVLYPGAESPAYVYVAGYSARSSVANGPGYWIKFGGAQSVSLSGLLVSLDTLPVQDGWNIVGSVSAGVAVPSIQSIPPGLVISSFFGYDMGYYTTDTIKPGRGYWVKSSGPGSLVLSSDPGAAPAVGRIRIDPTVDLPPSPPDVGGASQNRSGGLLLRQNYPNPFNPSTRIVYSLGREVHVNLSVYNVIGEKVATLVDAIEGPGEKMAAFDGSGLPGGVYFVRILAGGESDWKKIIILK